MGLAWYVKPAIGIIFAATALAWVFYMARIRAEQPAARIFLLLLGSVLFWDVSVVVNHVFPLPALRPWTFALVNLSVLTAPVLTAWLAFAFTRRAMAPPWSYIFGGYLALLVLGVLTNPWHQGFWRSPSASSAGGALGRHGPLFFAAALVDYAFVVAGVAFYARHIMRAPRIYRRQALLVLLVALVPVASSLLYFRGFYPLAVDLTWIALNLTVHAVGWGLFHQQLLTILPVVTFVLDTLPDGVVVINAAGRVLCLNARADSLLGRPGRSAVGRALAELSHSPLAHALEQWCRVGRGTSPLWVETPAGPRAVEVVRHTVGGLWPHDEATIFLLRDVTTRVRLEAEQRVRIRYLEAVARINHYLLDVHSLDDVPPVLRQIGEALDVDRVYAFENIDADGRPRRAKLFAHYARNTAPALRAQEFVYEDEGLGRWAKMLADGILVCGVTASFPAEERAWLEANGVASILVVPIFADGDFVGFVAADHCTELRPWLDVDKDFMLSVSAGIRSALERLRREAALERHNRLLSQLNDVIRTAMEATSLSDLLPRLAQQFRQTFSARACYLVLWEEPAEETGEPAVTAVACAGEGPVQGTPASVTAASLFRRLVATCRATGEPFCQMPDDGGTWVVIPLRDEEQDRMVGGAFLLVRGKGIREERRPLAIQFAHQVTLAINRVRLYDQLHEQNSRLNALYAVSAAVVSLDPAEVLERALEVIVHHLEWDAGWIVMPASGGHLDELPRVAASRNAPPLLLEVATRYPLRDCRACSFLYRRHDTALLLPVDECLHLRRDVLVRCGYHDVVGVPVRGSQDTLGVLFLVRRRRPEQRYREQRRELLSIGQHVGMALENARLHQAVREEIVRDPLTGIYNRRFLKEHLQWLFSVSRRVGREISVIMLDLDFFKQFNDRYGHLEGDDVLRTVAHLIERSVRSSDIVARYGGEEFTIVLPETGRQEAALVAERVRRAVADYPFRHYLFANAQRITVSLGVATAPEDAGSPEELLEAADQALYAAKAGGKNRVVVYHKVKAS